MYNSGRFKEKRRIWVNPTPLSFQRLAFLQLLLLLFNFSNAQQVENYYDLSELIQMEAVFKDSKTFVDCTPLYPTDTIVKRYQKESKNKGFAFHDFVIENYKIPINGKPVVGHIDQLWEDLKRSPDSATGSLIPLPYPYIVPGGRFSEIYYWDSYFTMLGLKESGKVEIIENMLNNFNYLIEEHGFIPNGNRSYYLSRSQPPFFSLMVNLYSSIKGDAASQKYLPALQKEYDFWMKDRELLNESNRASQRVVLVNGDVLNRYWDNEARPRPEAFKEDSLLAKKSKRIPADLYRNLRAACESGWDFSSRWLKDEKSLSTIQTIDIIPVDLNCLLFYLEMSLSKAYKLKGDGKLEKHYAELAEKRKKAILKYCWDQEKGFFMDYNFRTHKTTNVISLAGLYPLFFSLATAEQASKVKERTENELLKKYGLVTTLKATGQQWDYPNGWAPLQFISIEGLRNYGYHGLARRIVYKWVTHNIEIFESTGILVEKYNVVEGKAGAGGEYPTQDGFGWTNGVLLYLIRGIMDR